MTTTDPTQPEPDFFHDSYDRLLSSTTCSSSSSCSEIEDNNINNIDDDVSTGDFYNYNTQRSCSLAIPKFPIGVVNNYDVWISSPSSVDERRLRLLRRMGLGRDSALSRRKTSVSASVEANCSIIRSKSADHECSSKECDVSREIVPIADTVTISSVSNSNEGEEAVCRIRNLDNGKEFVVDEGKVKEVETGRRLTMEEFEMCVGRSPIVQELMRRENVEAACGGNESLRGEDSGNGNGNGSKVKKKSGWFKSIKNVASSVAGFKERRSSDDRDTSSERGGRRSSSATDDSQDVAFHGPERVRVRQYGKSCKDLSALYKSQEIHAHNGAISSIKFSLDGKYLASAGEDCLIHIWQVGSSDRKGDFLFDKQEDGNLNVLLLSNGSPELGLGSPILDTVQKCNLLMF